MTLEQLLNALSLGEDQEVEFKSAAGGLPKSLWETVSAMANTEGGTIILGVAEKRHRFELEPLPNPDALRKAFWDNHHNPQKLSIPLCHEQNILLMPVMGSTVMVIQVPRL